MLYFHMCSNKPILPHEKDLSNVWGLSLAMIRYVCTPWNSAVQGKTTAGVFWGSRHNMDSAAVAQSQILKNWDPLVHLWIVDAWETTCFISFCFIILHLENQDLEMGYLYIQLTSFTSPWPNPDKHHAICSSMAKGWCGHWLKTMRSIDFISGCWFSADWVLRAKYGKGIIGSLTTPDPYWSEDESPVLFIVRCPTRSVFERSVCWSCGFDRPLWVYGVLATSLRWGAGWQLQPIIVAEPWPSLYGGPSVINPSQRIYIPMNLWNIITSIPFTPWFPRHGWQ